MSQREVDSPYAWFRLAISILLATIGGVGNAESLHLLDGRYIAVQRLIFWAGGARIQAISRYEVRSVS